MANSSEQPTTVQQFLDQLYDPAWFKSSEDKRIFVRYYAIANLPKEKLTYPEFSIERYTVTGILFRFAIAEISDQKYKTNHPWLISTDSGKSAIFVEILERQLPCSLYILLSTPLSPGLPDWDKLSKGMDHLVALVHQ